MRFSILAITALGLVTSVSAKGIRKMKRNLAPELPVAVSTAALPPLRAQGTLWVNENDGSQVNLKGTNLGNWLLQEFWMMGQGGSDVYDQCTLENELVNRFEYTEKERLMKVFHDNWISTRDWDFLAGFGFNAVRLPLLWSIMEDENIPYTLRSDAWDYIDWAIEQAAERNMYTILDLHGVVGGQSGWDHTGCATTGEGQYWTNDILQDRTKWLWEQIATRYKENTNVAAYGLLNEPWGSTGSDMATRTKELYTAVRNIDPNHVIVLPGWYNDITFYTASDYTNVAYEIHPYPGLFNDRPNDEWLDIHRDWLRCGPDGVSGVCAKDQISRDYNAPLLVGEFQPWQGAGLTVGGKIARATYDTYAHYGWASTSWSYKLFSMEGGNGPGKWGMLTNAKVGLIVKAHTWDGSCHDWDTSFAEACTRSTDSIKVDFAAAGATKTFYIVLKTGSTGGNMDIVYDNISLINDDSKVEVIANGGFGSSSNWNEVAISGSISYEYDYTASVPSGGQGPSLRASRPATESGYINGAVYQAVTLTSGQRYSFGGVFRDNGSEHNSAWSEIYLLDTLPRAGNDISDPHKWVDFRTDDIGTIDALFTEYGTREYEVHDGLLHWLTTNERNDVFDRFPERDIPAKIQAEEYVDMQGVRTETCTDTGSGTNVAWLSPGDYFEYLINVPISGTYSIGYRVASKYGSSGFNLTLDNDTEIIDTQSVPATGGWQTWMTLESTADLSAGSHLLRFHVVGGSWNLNWLEFGNAISSTPSPTPPEVTSYPTTSPTPAPTSPPTLLPTKAPTAPPTPLPTPAPTLSPTPAPTQGPTKNPTRKPTLAPTQIPTKNPTRKPTSAPTQSPTMNPTRKPTLAPTQEPTLTPPAQESVLCGVATCTQQVLDTMACNDSFGGCYPCGSRINYLIDIQAYDETDACTIVTDQFSSVCGLCRPEIELPPAPPVDPTKLVWSDEFDVDGLPDSSKWNYDLGGHGWGNQELQHYTDRSENAFVSDGILNIRAVREDYEDSSYTSARLITKFKGDWTYGRIQVRARLLQCRATGSWAAIWMLPTDWTYGGWPDSGEIDIMEHVGYNEGKVHGSVHTKTFNHMIGTQSSDSIHTSVDEWHVYDILWDEEHIEFIFDGFKYHEFLRENSSTSQEWPFDQDFHLLLNVAVGGSWGGVEGVDEPAFEGDGQIMEVDWVRIYSI